MSDVDIPPRDTLPRPRRQGYAKDGSLFSEIIRKERLRYRGVPPPFAFDINTLPDSTFLTEVEVAAIIRRPPSCLFNWRKNNPDHPLRWRRVSGRILYELVSVREFLKGDK
jgi:hypothetical protein